MQSSVNPYGVGSYQNLQNLQRVNPAQNIENPQVAQNIAQEQGNTEVQELPNISQTALEIRKFSDGIKGANEMIGALQIADITLNALGNQLKSGATDLSALDATAKAAQFKGEALFGKELRISLADESVALSLPLPSQIQGDVSAGIANKHQEISETMTRMSGLIEKASLPFSAPNGEGFDFENFNPASLKGLFG